MINSKNIKNYMTLQNPYTVKINKIDGLHFWYTDSTYNTKKMKPTPFKEFNTSHDNFSVGDELKIIGKFVGSFGYEGLVYERLSA